MLVKIHSSFGVFKFESNISKIYDTPIPLSAPNVVSFAFKNPFYIIKSKESFKKS